MYTSIPRGQRSGVYSAGCEPSRCRSAEGDVIISSTSKETPAMVAAATRTTCVPNKTAVTQGSGVVPLSETPQPSGVGPTEVGDGGLSDQDGAVALNTGKDAGELFNELAEALLSEADARKTKKARRTTQARFLEWRREQHMPEERVIQLAEILAYLNLKTDHRQGAVPAAGTLFAWMSQTFIANARYPDLRG
eukprot:Nk52_evm10s533 gene=Nk52_evmTU10s533